jgi:hypothetical protein
MKRLSTNYNTSGFCVNEFYEAQFTFTFTTIYTHRRIRTSIEGPNEDGGIYV